MKRSEVHEHLANMIDEGELSPNELAEAALETADEHGAKWDPEESELPKSITKLAIWHPSGSITAYFRDGSHRPIGYVYGEFIGTVGPDFCDAYNRLQAGELMSHDDFMPAVAGEMSAALSRLAREAGVPDDGPDEIVEAVLAKLGKEVVADYPLAVVAALEALAELYRGGDRRISKLLERARLEILSLRDKQEKIRGAVEGWE